MGTAIRLGLTGGIGSGKTTVAQMLGKLGAIVIDADAISRQTTSAGGPAIKAIEKTFGAELITREGALDRERMRELVFSNPVLRRQLEDIIHPLVAVEIRHQATLAARTGCRCTVYDIPLLVESGYWRAQLDRVLVVDCLADTQIERVMQRSGLARTAVENILAHQASRDKRLHAADAVICNDELPMDELEEQVRQLAPIFGL
jgi:dephospho-CoA kinase